MHSTRRRQSSDHGREAHDHRRSRVLSALFVVVCVAGLFILAVGIASGEDEGGEGAASEAAPNPVRELPAKRTAASDTFLLSDGSLETRLYEVPEGLDGRTAAAVQWAIDEAFVAGYRVAMLIAAGLALASAVVAGIMIEGKGRAVESREPGRAGGETAPA